MQLKTKILDALASGPKFYAGLLKLAKTEKQLIGCLRRMTRDKAIVLRIKDGQNEYSLNGKAHAHAAAPSDSRPNSAARFSIDHKGNLTIAKTGAPDFIELDPGEFAELRTFVEKTSEIHSPADA